MEKKKVVEVVDFTKDYGQGRGVFDISFDIFEGEFFGFLGPNGAGKSTTIRHIMGFSKPDKGEIRVLGQKIKLNKRNVLEEVGYLPGEVNLHEYLRGIEFIKQQMQLKRVKSDDYLKKLLKEFPLNLDEEIKFMSLGDKRKLAILSSFLSNPSILILDEPTSGLDPLSQKKFREFLLKEKSLNKTILLSSHIFKEIDDTCDRIAIIKDGKIVSCFNRDDFNLKDRGIFNIVFKNKTGFISFLKHIDDNIKIISKDDKNYTLMAKVDEKSLNNFFAALSDLDILKMIEVKESLESYFLSFYKEEKTYVGI